MKLTPEQVEDIRQTAMTQVFLYEQGDIPHPSPYIGMFDTRCNTLWHLGYEGGPYPGNNGPTHGFDMESYRAWAVGQLTRDLSSTKEQMSKEASLAISELLTHLAEIMPAQLLASVDTDKWNAVARLRRKEPLS